MNSQKLIIYDFNELFNILNEFKKDLNFDILNVSKNNLLQILSDVENNYLVVSKNSIPNISNQILIEAFPIRISKLVEKLNIEFLKRNFSNQSEIVVGNYKINLNSRELTTYNKKIRLTEKETSIILYLSKLGKPIKIDELQSNVWGYQSELETHTVETHIYRLRKKILKNFDDENFIVSKKDG
jgi:hypothetical protein